MKGPVKFLRRIAWQLRGSKPEPRYSWGYYWKCGCGWINVYNRSECPHCGAPLSKYEQVKRR
jgi:rubrerythrin